MLVITALKLLAEEPFTFALYHRPLLKKLSERTNIGRQTGNTRLERNPNVLPQRFRDGAEITPEIIAVVQTAIQQLADPKYDEMCSTSIR